MIWGYHYFWKHPYISWGWLLRWQWPQGICTIFDRRSLYLNLYLPPVTGRGPHPSYPILYPCLWTFSSMKIWFRYLGEKCNTQSGLLSAGLIFGVTIVVNEWNEWNYETRLFQNSGEFLSKGEVNECEWLDSQDSIIVINDLFFFGGLTCWFCILLGLQGWSFFSAHLLLAFLQPPSSLLAERIQSQRITIDIISVTNWVIYHDVQTFLMDSWIAFLFCITKVVDDKSKGLAWFGEAFGVGMCWI